MKKEILPIAYIKSDFKEKFGIPRQSGRAKSCIAKIFFLDEYNTPDAIKGIEEFSHLWLLFGFSKCKYTKFKACVRPPRLGGNKRVGVFASRAPYRPNGIGLSSVRLISADKNSNQISLTVSGADLLDGTPIYDIKPYVPSSDCHIDAKGGFSDDYTNYSLEVVFDCDFPINFPEDKKQALKEILSDDPRPAYHNDTREYGMRFDAFNVKFFVEDKKLFVVAIENL